MGISLSYMTPRGKEVPIDVGWRSMMNELLGSRGLVGRKLYGNDIETLSELGETQFKGEREEPFDWAEDIAIAFAEIAEAIRSEGHVVILANW